MERICQFLFEHQEAAGITEDLQDAWMELSVVCDLDLLDDRQLGERLAAWQWLTIRTYRIAVENWEDIEGVTEELLAHGIVSYQRLKEIVPS